MDTKAPPADAGSVTQDDRISALAQSLDCLAESDLCLLLKVTPKTAESWRKRGKGPAYALVGTAYLYPRQAVADFIRANVRERTNAPAAGVL